MTRCWVPFLAVTSGWSRQSLLYGFHLFVQKLDCIRESLRPELRTVVCSRLNHKHDFWALKVSAFQIRSQCLDHSYCSGVGVTLHEPQGRKVIFDLWKINFGSPNPNCDAIGRTNDKRRI